MTTLDLTLETLSGTTNHRIEVNKAIIAGWTGSDKEALEKHIVELEELGVQRPPSTPVYYPVSASRLTTATNIEVLGNDSSGEVEFVMLKTEGELWIGIGSDHTDREVETYNITVSKQMCDKPVAPKFWRLSEIDNHWDKLLLRSFIVENGERKLYQEGPITAMIRPEEIIAKYQEYTGNSFNDNTLMFGGTLAAIGGIRPSASLEIEITDPVLDRSISYLYNIQSI